SFTACASVPPISASRSSTAKPASCSRVQFLRRLELARAGRPLPLRRVPHLARATVEPAPRQDRALALEPGAPRRSRDPAGRRESRPAGVPGVGVAAGGQPAGGGGAGRVRGVTDADWVNGA